MIDKYNDTTSLDNRLSYSTSYAMDGLERTIRALPRGASEAELREATRLLKLYMDTLMTTVKEVENELDSRINLVNFTEKFFDNRRAL